MNLYIYEETTSTNNLGREALFHHGDIIWAWSQSAGRGQRGNRWIGGEGENITFSVVLEPTFLNPSDQFRISQITALALCDAMVEYGINSKIKWTNDIYIGDHKMAGILIENSINADSVTRSIVGIGLNINQLEFDPSLPNPTSMRRVAGKRFSREEILKSVYISLIKWCNILKSGDVGLIDEQYHKLLYRLHERHTYRLANGEKISATIEGVENHGELMLKDDDGNLKGYLFREVEFVIEGRDR